ncbi:endonuclease/exonuclease/phosphatase family [Stachybotrys elegans]|uniref:Endonuclease/exonuclease/phosphatase family n=1 Tax=Stachybotrys elegans TaxID=80388 RepID=A0A8K0WTN7_9HYPO|nr:endonuclease/exonuclease/phosphatase family [Stachybotrys elegans]
MTPIWASPTIRQASGSLSLAEDEPLFTFEYATDAPSSTNWIGLYHASGGGPDNEEMDTPSLLWEYAPEAAGSVSLPASSLEPGSYKAYFLANDGYAWLAEPIVVELPEQVSFIVSNFTTHNARQGDAFEASIGGLLGGRASDSDIRFLLSSPESGEWTQVSTDGTISGTPGSDATDTRISIAATSSGGQTLAEIEVLIPVRQSGSPVVERLSIMTYNLWHGGSRVNDYHAKQVRYLAGSGADIVGVQESTGDHATRLANALGWHSWQGRDVGFISRYPIVSTGTDLGYAGSALIALDGSDSQVKVWNGHLGYDPYGPYDFCFDQMSVDRVMQREEQSGRTPQIINIMSAMEGDLENSDNIPVILLGDFNAPSHLDYTEALREKNCGYANVPWPTSIHPTDAGMVDSFRVAHPDPVAEEGITWSPIFLTNNGRPEPLDRIDFIYHKSSMGVLSSEDIVIGNPSPEPNHQNNEWTSDHAAVLTIFEL